MARPLSTARVSKSPRHTTIPTTKTTRTASLNNPLLLTSFLILSLTQSTLAAPTPSETGIKTAPSPPSPPTPPPPPPSPPPPAQGPKPLASGVIFAIFLAGVVVIGSIIGYFVVVKMNKSKKLYEEAEAAKQAEAAKLNMNKGSIDYGNDAMEMRPPVPPKEMGRPMVRGSEGVYRKGDWD
ncbi:unnamed protein product [Periconia digitata]|uniref:Uncharacterized protein n=1 Tax=Periconia digitata TaxID=1303443 RepID=A0A9W4XI76_9PLEO|nr:unnamed protein product [Periconia digitata]